MIELGAVAGTTAPVVVEAVVCCAVPPRAWWPSWSVRDDSLPERSPRNVSAMRVASALRRNTT